MKKYTLKDLTTITGPELTNVKIIVKNKEVAEAVQLALFRVGGSWFSGDRVVLYQERAANFCKYLYISSYNHLLMTRDDAKPYSRKSFNGRHLERIIIKE